jgi:predicted nucleotidyltransferase
LKPEHDVEKGKLDALLHRERLDGLPVPLAKLGSHGSHAGSIDRKTASFQSCSEEPKKRAILARLGEMDVDESKLTALKTYFEERPEMGVASVYLFGSQAEGRAHSESDVDVAVLLDRGKHPTAGDRFDARVRLGSELISVLGTNAVDVVILNDVPPLFGRRILYEGKKLFVGDPEADHVFTRDVQLQAADLAPFLERMRRIKLEALAR